MKRTIKTEVDVKGLGAALAMTDPVAVAKATPRAVNRLAKQANTAASKKARTKFNVPAKILKSGVRVIKATPGKDYATIQVRQKAIGLTSYGAKQGKRGVTVKIIKKKGRQKVKGAFVAVPSQGPHPGRQGVFKRLGLDRYPVRRLFGPSVRDIFARPGVQRVIKRYVQANGERIFAAEYIAQRDGLVRKRKRK